MDTFNRIGFLIQQATRVFGEKLTETVPSLLLGIIVIAIAWLFARLVSGGFERLLRTISFDKFADKIKITQFLDRTGIQISPSAIIGRFIYWVFVLLIISSAAETLQWVAVSTQIQRFLDYLPNLVIALVVLVFGSYLISQLRDFLRRSMTSLGISTGRVLSNVVYYVLSIMLILTALQQAKIDTSIISANLLIIISAIMFAAALSYGFASRDILANILSGYYSRRTFLKGMLIEVNGIRGIVVDTSNVAITLKTSETEQVVIPLQQLVNSTVKIIKND